MAFKANTRGKGNSKFNNNYFRRANKQIGNLSNMLKQDWSYNPESDPIYNAAQQLSGIQAQRASDKALNTLNDRGILNSSMSAERLGQIQQSAQNNVLALIPDLANNAYQRRQDKLGNTANLIQTLLTEGNSQQQHAIEEGKLTGNYLPFKARNLIQGVLQSKRNWNKAHRHGNEKGERQAHQQANQLRQQLRSLGIDPSNIAADDTLKQAMKAATSMGKKTLAERQFESDRALQEGKLTGNYLSSKAQKLIQQIIQDKRDWANADTKGEKRAAHRDAVDLRAQLDMMGVNTSEIGANDTLGHALRNLPNGRDTLGRDQLQEDKRQFDKGLSEKKREFNKNYSFDKNKWNQTYGLQRDKFKWTKIQDQVANELKRRGLDIEQARAEISRMNARTDRDYHAFLRDQGISEQKAARATNKLMATLFGANSAAEAATYIADHADEIKKSGANVSEVLNVLDRRWPGVKKAVTQKAPNFLTK